MISRLMQTVNSTDNLYFTPPRQKEILEYAKSLPNRFKALRSVQEFEADLAQRIIKEWERSHPELGSSADCGWPEAVNDLRAFLRAAALAIVLDDPAYTDLRAGDTLRRFLGFLDLPVGTINDLFSTIQDVVKEVLPPAASEWMLSYLSAETQRATVTA